MSRNNCSVGTGSASFLVSLFLYWERVFFVCFFVCFYVAQAVLELITDTLMASKSQRYSFLSIMVLGLRVCANTTCQTLFYVKVMITLYAGHWSWHIHLRYVALFDILFLCLFAWCIFIIDFQKIFLNICLSRLWWYKPLYPALERQRQADIWCWVHPGLQSE